MSYFNKAIVTVALLVLPGAWAAASELPGNNPGEIPDDVFANPAPRDFADLELKFPVTKAERETFVPTAMHPGSRIPVDAAQNFRQLNQQQLENLYGRLESGPIPDGAFAGAVILPRGGESEAFYQMAHKMGLLSTKNELRSLDEKLRAAALDLRRCRMIEWEDFLATRQEVEKFAMSVWRGKTFYKSDGVLKNQIGPHGMMLFPAKLYCGQSLLDRRRQSVVIDYQYSMDLTRDYNPLIDWIATKDGVNVRDEIRMIRPGLYLGRAYMNGVFVLNFVLYQADSDNDWTEECGVQS